MSDSKESKSSSSSASSTEDGVPTHAHRPSEVTMSPLLQHSSIDTEKAAAYAKHSYPKNKIKILLLERISKTAIDEFVNEGFAVECLDKLNEQELIEKIKDVHALGIRSRTQLTSEVLSAAKKLLVVGAFCIGTDQVNLNSAAKCGTAVFNAPFANTRSVAELVLAEMIMLARQATDRSMECHKGVWNKASSRCYEVRGKTVGIVGYGHVGSQLSVLAEALGMHVVFFDIIPKLPLGNARPVKTLNDLLQNSDFVSLHVPATNETHQMIGEQQVKLMRKGAYLINAARGTVVDIPHVAAALKSGYLGGAAFDVFPNEPENVGEKFENQLQGAKNTILTPHIGGSTEEAQAAIGREVSLKMIHFINTGSTVGAVNFPEMGLPLNPHAHRILNIHQNVPGVLRDVNNILSEYNVVAQVLMTLGEVGYLMADVDKSISLEVKEKISLLKSSIRTRILF